jgi:hypothetical protein
LSTAASALLATSLTPAEGAGVAGDAEEVGNGEFAVALPAAVVVAMVDPRGGEEGEMG